MHTINFLKQAHLDVEPEIFELHKQEEGLCQSNVIVLLSYEWSKLYQINQLYLLLEHIAFFISNLLYTIHYIRKPILSGDDLSAYITKFHVIYFDITIFAMLLDKVIYFIISTPNKVVG